MCIRDRRTAGQYTWRARCTDFDAIQCVHTRTHAHTYVRTNGHQLSYPQSRDVYPCHCDQLLVSGGRRLMLIPLRRLRTPTMMMIIVCPIHVHGVGLTKFSVMSICTYVRVCMCVYVCARTGSHQSQCTWHASYTCRLASSQTVNNIGLTDVPCGRVVLGFYMEELN